MGVRLVAMQNSHAEADDELYPLREVPRESGQDLSTFTTLTTWGVAGS